MSDEASRYHDWKADICPGDCGHSDEVECMRAHDARVRAKALREAEAMLRRRAGRASAAGATCVGLDGEIVRMHAGIYEAMIGEAETLRAMADDAEKGHWP